ncbi:hypothetical protein LguiA_000290 [Lonicera macranthoides]
MHFIATCVYGYNEKVLRYPLWEDLKEVYRLVRGHHWLVIGDFNVVRAPEKRICGDVLDLAEIRDFNDCLYDIEAFEMNTKGFLFIWHNKRECHASIKSRIDRAFVSDVWLQQFPNVEANARAGGGSNHSPIVISIAKQIRRGNKAFKIFNYWMEHHQFGSIISDFWNAPCQGSAMSRVFSKLKRLKPALRDLNKKWYSKISFLVKASKEELIQW